MANFTAEQLDVGRTIYSVGQSLGVTPLQMRAAFAAAWVESRFKNLNYGDRDSVGVFQQRPSQGWGTVAQILDVSYAARKFFEEAKRVSQSGTAGNLAQRVQRSGFPSRYDEQIATADDMLAQVSGGVPLNVSPVSLLGGTNNTVLIGLALLLFVVLVTD